MESADNHVKLNSGTNLEKGYIGPRHFRYYYINSERRMKFISTVEPLPNPHKTPQEDVEGGQQPKGSPRPSGCV